MAEGAKGNANRARDTVDASGSPCAVLGTSNSVRVSRSSIHRLYSIRFCLLHW
jgi:hypothetical protein